MFEIQIKIVIINIIFIHLCFATDKNQKSLSFVASGGDCFLKYDKNSKNSRG